jgi:hypothetical protein
MGQQVHCFTVPHHRAAAAFLEVAVVGFNDEPGVRRSLRGVDQIYHLSSSSQDGAATSHI